MAAAEPLPTEAMAPARIVELMGAGAEDARVAGAGAAALLALAARAGAAGRDACAAAGAIPALVAATERHAGEVEVCLAATGALKALASEAAHCDACVAAGALAALVGALARHAGETRLCAEASGALQNLTSNSAARKDACAAAGAIPALVGVLRRHEGEASACQSAAGALANIANSGPANKDACVAAGAIPALIDALARHAAALGVCRNACLALRCLLPRPAAATAALAHGALPALLDALRVLASSRAGGAAPAAAAAAAAVAAAAAAAAALWCVADAFAALPEWLDAAVALGAPAAIAAALRAHRGDAGAAAAGCAAVAACVAGSEARADALVAAGAAAACVEALAAHSGGEGGGSGAQAAVVAPALRALAALLLGEVTSASRRRRAAAAAAAGAEAVLAGAFRAATAAQARDDAFDALVAVARSLPAPPAPLPPLLGAELPVADAAAAAGAAAAPFSRLGISLEGLEAFVAGQGGAAGLAGLTTTQVCALVKQQSPAGAYCDKLAASSAEAHLVGPATEFVSHAWGCVRARARSTLLFSGPLLPPSRHGSRPAFSRATPLPPTPPPPPLLRRYNFMDVVGALRAWHAAQAAPQRPTVFFWFDLFSNSQVNCVARPFEWWMTVFTRNVCDIGHTLLVLAWDNPIPLTRCWCLVEIAASLQDSVEFEVIMPPAEEAKFQAALLHSFDSLVLKLCAVEVSRATAYHGAGCLVPAPAGGTACEATLAPGGPRHCPNDLARIHRAVREGLGYGRVNSVVTGRLREWMARRGARALEALPEATRLLSPLALGLCRLHLAQGRLGEAQALLERVGEALGAAGCSPAQPQAQAAVALMLELQRARGSGAPSYDQGLVAAAHGLAKGRAAAPPAERAAALLLLGDAMLDAGIEAGEVGGERLEAAALYREARRLLRGARGAAHVDGLAPLEGLARLHEAHGRLPEALAARTEAWVAASLTLEPTHPRRVAAAAAAAEALASSGPLLPPDAPVWRATGLSAAAFPFAAALEAGIVSPFRRPSDGALARAEELLRYALVCLEVVLGAAHPEALGAANALGAVLLARGQASAAEPLLRRALEGRRRALEGHHADIGRSALNLGLAARALGDASGAAELFRQAYSVLRRARGEVHPFAQLARACADGKSW